MELDAHTRKFTHEPGETLLGDFVVQKGVGVGGFGEVYYATSRAGKDVALKRVQRNFDIELRGVRHCLNLRHPNLVQLYDIQTDDRGTPWVIMEYIGGDSLKDVIDRNPTGLTDQVIHHWFKGLAAGVVYLHDNDVVHRDLKPGNIFLDNGIVKIGDYGLAKLIASTHGSGQTQTVGTFHYMAPEIGRGKYGRRIDIYALGVMLYEMVTGRVPFEGESSQEIIMKHLTSSPDLHNIGQPYHTAISRAMAKAPDRRYATVEAMLADLNMHPSYYEPATVRSSDAVGAEVGTASLDAPVTIEALPAPRDIVSAEAIAEPTLGALADEPLARHTHQLIHQLRDSWHEANYSTPTKFLLMLIAVLLFVLNARWLVPLAFFAGPLYAGYLLVWMLLTPATSGSKKRPSGLLSTHAMPPSSQHQQLMLHELKSGRIDISREIFVHRGRLERALELVRSMLLSTVAVTVLSVLMLVVGSSGDENIYNWGPTLAWMGVTCVLGTWTLLLHGKLFERSLGDPVLRRFSMLVAGMLLGAISGVVANYLLLEPSYLLEMQPTLSNSTRLYKANGSPQFLGGICYFGALMFLLRWWRMSDPLRKSRLSMMTTVGCVATAILLHFVLPYPRGFLIAATIAMATQIAAPWLNDQQRRKLIERGAPVVPVDSDNGGARL